MSLSAQGSTSPKATKKESREGSGCCAHRCKAETYNVPPLSTAQNPVLAKKNNGLRANLLKSLRRTDLLNSSARARFCKAHCTKTSAGFEFGPLSQDSVFTGTLPGIDLVHVLKHRASYQSDMTAATKASAHLSFDANHHGHVASPTNSPRPDHSHTNLLRPPPPTPQPSVQGGAFRPIDAPGSPSPGKKRKTSGHSPLSVPRASPHLLAGGDSQEDRAAARDIKRRLDLVRDLSPVVQVAKMLQDKEMELMDVRRLPEEVCPCFRRAPRAHDRAPHTRAQHPGRPVGIARAPPPAPRLRSAMVARVARIAVTVRGRLGGLQATREPGPAPKWHEPLSHDLLTGSLKGRCHEHVVRPAERLEALVLGCEALGASSCPAAPDAHPHTPSHVHRRSAPTWIPTLGGAVPGARARCTCSRGCG